MRQLILTAMLLLPLVFGGPASWAQTEAQPLPPYQEDNPAPPSDAASNNATYRLLTTLAGALGAASLAAILADGWIVELMTLEGLSTAQASSVVANLESEGGLEAAVTLMSAILGGIGGDYLGQWLFPEPALPEPTGQHKLQSTAWPVFGLRPHVPF